MVEWRFFGVDGEPVMHKVSGAATVKLEYDVDGKPIRLRTSGAAKIVMVRDARGNVVEEHFYDELGNAANNNTGYAAAMAERDAFGRLVEERYFGPDGRPILRANNTGSGEEIEDLFGRFTRLILSGAMTKDEIEQIGTGGFARVTQQFDARGNATRRAFFDVDDRPVRGLNGVPEEQVEYDAYGRPVLFKPVFGGDIQHGAAGIWTRVTYAAPRNVARIDYVDPAGKLVNGNQGFASIVIEPTLRGLSRAVLWGWRRPSHDAVTRSRRAMLTCSGYRHLPQGLAGRWGRFA